MKSKELVKHTFIDGDFSMEINVSEEERTIYMNQTEIGLLLGVNQATISRNIKKMDISKWDSYAENATICIEVATGATNYYSLGIVKEIGQKYNPERIEKLENWLSDLLSENELEIIDNEYEIVRYNQDNLNIPVRLDKSTNSLWMTQKEMADLYDTSRQDIAHHIQNLLDDQEIEYEGMCKYYLPMLVNGRRYKTTIYSIDVILIVGYRVRTQKAINFRKWASGIIKEHLYSSYFGKSDNYLPAFSLETNSRLATIEERIDRLESKNIVHFRNVSFDAYLFLTFQFSTARKEIFIIDVYADEFLISALKAVQDGVKVIIVAGKNCRITKEEIEIYHRSHPNVEVTIMEEIDEHDRHVFIDRKTGFMLGSSINTLGYYDSHIIEINDNKYIKEIIEKYIKLDD